MAPQGRRGWLGLLGRYFVLITVLGLVATSVYAAVDADTRSTVLRLAVTAFVAVVLLHIHSHFRGQLEFAPPSAFDQAKQAQSADVKVASVVVRLVEQVQGSVASERYFKTSLWPRLVQLSEQRGTRERLHELRGRPWLRRGPSLPAIAELIRRIGDEDEGNRD